jgi:hypothetical protein
VLAGGGEREKIERMAMAVRSCVNLTSAAIPPCSYTAVRFSGQSLHAVRRHAAAYFLRVYMDDFTLLYRMCTWIVLYCYVFPPDVYG